jgi:hypothetical protein
MLARMFATAALALCLAGCEGMIGGEEVARIPLQPAADGSYEPVRIMLRTDMNPVALTLLADFAWGGRDQAGLWNDYRVVLRSGDKVIATRDIQVNSPEKPNTSSSPPPTALVHTLLLMDVPADGEYEVVISAHKPAAVTLESPHLGVRMKVPRPQS